MALIKCPECGGEVSSNADKCVHCGCNYSYCPECEAVHLGKVDVCLSCGYRINGARAESKGASADEFTAACAKRASTDRVVDRVLKVVQTAMPFVSIALIIFAFIPLIKWDADSFDAIIKAKELIEQARGLTIAASIILVIPFTVFSLREIYFHILYAKWLTKYNIDVVKYLKKDDVKITATFMTEDGFYGDVATLAYLTVVPHDASMKIVKTAAQVLLTAGICIAFGYFCMQSVEGIINMKLYDSSFKLPYAPIIAAFALAAVRVLISAVCDKTFSKRKDEWLKSVNLL
ncbi:MAG: hypothetical protein NC033_06010 [Clostridiales bacterium]|nr:hypothetical protein [Clostridiales bacterium]